MLLFIFFKTTFLLLIGFISAKTAIGGKDDMYKGLV